MALTKISRGLLSTGVSDSSDATAITIDSSENVGIGATSSSTKVTIQAADTDTVNSSANGHLTFYDDAPFGYYKIRIATTNRDLAFDGYDTDSAWKEILKLDRVDQRINSKGGIMFGSDTASANTLDDYEEGTWQPTNADSGETANMNAYNATYTKIGNFVSIRFDILNNSGNNANLMGGLPFPVKTGAHGAIQIAYNNSSSATTGFSTGYCNAGSSYIRFTNDGGTGAWEFLNGYRIIGFGAYETDS